MTESTKMRYSEKITNKKMILFTLSGPIGGLLFGMWGNIQFFAASVLLIPQAVITVIYLIYSIVDSINDPLLGYLSDRSKRFTAKFGKRFPWIMIGAIISPILLILCFIQVAQINVDESGQVLNPEAVLIASIWLCVIMVIYETFRTLHEINHTSLFPDLFREENQRRKVSGVGGIVGGITSILSAILIPLFIASLGGATSLTAYLFTTIIIIIIVYLLIFPYNLGVRETDKMKAFRVELDDSGKGTSPVKEVVIRIFRDKNWMAIVITNFCWAIAGACMLYGLNFFILHNLGLGIESTILPGLFHIIVSIISAPIWITVAKKIGVKKTYLVSLILNVIGFLAFYFVTDIIGVIIVLAYVGVPTSANYGVIIFLAKAEGIDNAAVNSGKREEGSYNGILRVFSAFSYASQTLIFALVAGITGYNPVLEANQTPFAKWGLNLQMSLIPMVIILIGTIIFALMYKIRKEDAVANKEKLKELGL